MNLKKTDVLAIVLVILQMQLLLELLQRLSFTVLQDITTTFSLLASLQVLFFTSTIIANLKGCLLAIDAYFADEKDQTTLSRQAAYMLVFAAFLFATVYILVHSTASVY